MTIVYLPLGFVAALYGIDMFDFELPGQTRWFAITTVVVSLATYLAAWGLLYGVRQRRKKGGFGEMLSGPRARIRPTVNAAKRVFYVGNGPKQAANSSQRADIEVGMDQELPPEQPAMDERKVKEKTSQERRSSWNAIPGWLTRRHPRQEAGV